MVNPPLISDCARNLQNGRCLSAGNRLRVPVATLAQKGGKLYIMKYLAIAALVAASLGLGACAHKAEPAPTTTTHAASTGYQK